MFSISFTSKKYSWGIDTRIPAPSPVFSSHPHAPRCAMRSSISIASVTCHLHTINKKPRSPLHRKLFQIIKINTTRLNCQGVELIYSLAQYRLDDRHLCSCHDTLYLYPKSVTKDIFQVFPRPTLGFFVDTSKYSALGQYFVI